MRLWNAVMATLLVMGVVACGGGGDSDKNTPPPAGKPGVTISSPRYDAQSRSLTVEFTVMDSQGRPITGLTPSFTLAQLIEEEQGRAGTISRWQSLLNRSRNRPADSASSIPSVIQPTTNPTANGALTDHGDGRYSYLIKQVPYGTDTDPVNGQPLQFVTSRTTRLGIQLAATDSSDISNPTYDWVPDGGPLSSRTMVETKTCNNCHDKLALHGGGRVEVSFCVTCHNQGNTGYGRSFVNKVEQNELSLDFRVMLHKIHRGKDLPQVEATDGGQYMVYGFRDTKHLYAANDAGTLSGVHFPQDLRNCSTCHDDSNSKTPEANHWFSVPSTQTCGSCHEDHSANHFSSTEFYCANCHGPKPTLRQASVKVMHEGRLASLQAGRDTLQMTMESARYQAPNVLVEVRLRRDGVGVNSLGELLPYLHTGKAYVLVNWDNGQGDAISYTENRIDMASGCVAQGDGLFLCQKSMTQVPADNAVLVVANAEMALCADRKALENGKPASLAQCSALVDRSGNPEDADLHTIAANVAHGAFDLGGSPVSYQEPVGVNRANCNSCHKDLTVHERNHNAKDFVQCTSCHNATRAAFYAGFPADLKYHVHSFHAMGSHREGESRFPGIINNCENCHTQAQYNLPNQQNPRPSLATTTADNKNPKYFSPTLVVCASCHLKSPLGLVNPTTPASGDEWASHMRSNGAVFGADSAAAASGTEQCASCHAVGQEQGVDKVHKVYDYRAN